MRIVTLITDYGTRDFYVGALKGVILSIAPDARVVDVTHDIEPHNVLHGAFVLRHVWPCYPAGTIHLAVVDPGVGSPRRILLGKYSGQYLVAPDNGLITWLNRDFSPEAMYLVEEHRYFLPDVSATFHGRDIMAPVAAHLANGVEPRLFGRVAGQVETFPLAHRAEATGEGFRGCVVYVDRFGNLVTNIHERQLGSFDRRRSCKVYINGVDLGPVRRTFSEVSIGNPVALIGGAGLLEVAVHRGNAAERYGPIEAAVVEVR